MRCFLPRVRSNAFPQNNRVNPSPTVQSRVSTVRSITQESGAESRVSTVRPSVNLFARPVPQEVDTELIDVPTASLFDAAIPVDSTHEQEVRRRENVIAALRAEEISIRTDIFNLKRDHAVVHSTVEYVKKLREAEGQLEKLKKDYERVRSENRALFDDHVKQTTIMQRLYRDLEKMKDLVEAADKGCE